MFDPERQREGATMELSSLLATDGALVVFLGFGLVATGLAIVRDIPTQERIIDPSAPV